MFFRVFLILFVCDTLQYEEDVYDYSDYTEYSEETDYASDAVFKPDRSQVPGHPVPATPHTLQYNDIQETLRRILPAHKAFFTSTHIEKDDDTEQNYRNHSTHQEFEEISETRIKTLQSMPRSKRYQVFLNTHTLYSNESRQKEIAKRLRSSHDDDSEPESYHPRRPTQNVNKISRTTQSFKSSRWFLKDKERNVFEDTTLPETWQHMARSKRFQSHLTRSFHINGTRRRSQKSSRKERNLIRNEEEDYLPGDFFVFRTLKSKFTVGLQTSQQEEVKRRMVSSKNMKPTRTKQKETTTTEMDASSNIVYNYLEDMEYSGELVIPTTATTPYTVSKSIKKIGPSNVRIRNTRTKPLDHRKISSQYITAKGRARATQRKPLSERSTSRRSTRVPVRLRQTVTIPWPKTSVAVVTQKQTIIYIPPVQASVNLKPTRTRQSKIIKSIKEKEQETDIKSKPTRTSKLTSHSLSESMTRQKSENHKSSTDTNKNAGKNMGVIKNTNIISLSNISENFVKDTENVALYPVPVKDQTQFSQTYTIDNKKTEANRMTKEIESLELSDYESLMWQRRIPVATPAVLTETNKQALRYTATKMVKNYNIYKDIVVKEQSLLDNEITNKLTYAYDQSLEKSEIYIGTETKSTQAYSTSAMDLYGQISTNIPLYMHVSEDGEETVKLYTVNIVSMDQSNRLETESGQVTDAGIIVTPELMSEVESTTVTTIDTSPLPQSSTSKFYIKHSPKIFLKPPTSSFPQLRSFSVPGLRQMLPLSSFPSLTSSSLQNLSPLSSSQLRNLPTLSSSQLPNLPTLSSSQLPNLPQLSSSQLPNLPPLSSSQLPNLPQLSSSQLPTLPPLSSSQLPNLPQLSSSQLPTLPPLSSSQLPNLPPLSSSQLPNLPELSSSQSPASSNSNSGSATSLPASSGETVANATTATVSTTKGFDVDMFLEILANLTYDYDTNLTLVMNMTLRERGAPTCGTPKGWYAWMGWPNFTYPTTTPTPTTTTTEPAYEAPRDLNNTIIAKCFVCGLKERGIPYNTDCADAFAGDFLPLVPMNPIAKAKTASYRKYCRYGQIYNYFENKTRPKSIYGRWTGGCSVRWTDLTGLYTQRACRNRRRPTTGEHYASKRMAKLELALSHTDDGCIITPAATLLPMSRGISLYSRFHACVCTGSWCNRAPAPARPAPAPPALAAALAAVFGGLFFELYLVRPAIWYIRGWT